jgi:peptide/nickel transport system permease protein
MFGNPALMIGLAGVLALLVLGVFGVSLAPRDPNAGASLLMTDLPNGNTTFRVPPTLPDADHWFGTDGLGRDLWSRVLAGARLTLTIVLAAAVVRLAIGFSLGIVTGWYGGAIARALRVVAAGITAVPQLILAIMLVEVTRGLGAAGYIASLALVGWPEIVEYLHIEVGRAKASPFIEAAKSVGASDRRLITRHLVTTLGPQLLTLAALETGAVLLLLAELGLVGLFLTAATALVGGDSGYAGTLKERAPEWGQMLGSIQFFAMSSQLSTLLPAVFVVLASTAFTLLADGLRAASDPFSPRALLPGTFGMLAKALAACLCVSAIGFVGFNVRPTVLSMEDGRALAAKTAQSTWPGSVFVAGVVRWSSAAHGLDRPEKLTYYYRNASNEVLRISYLNGDPLAADVRPYETEDEIDFTTLKPLPAGLISYDQPTARAEQTVGAAFRQFTPNYLVRAIVTWPSDRDSPVYLVTYGTTSRDLAIRRACCFDARTGEPVDSVVVPRVDPPWPVPAGCAVSRTVVQQIDRFTGYFVFGNAVAVGTPSNLYFQGDNFIEVTGRAGVPALDRAANIALPDAAASIVNGQPAFTIPGGGVMAFATLRLGEPGCWTVRVSIADSSLEYTLYAYPYQCHPSRDLVNPPPPGIAPRPCTAPSR